MGQTIRQAEKRDQEAVVECVQAAYSKYVERIGKRPAPMLADYSALITQGVVSVLVDDEDIRAILVMWPEDGYLFVDNIAVDPRFQGQGLGHTLIAFVEQQAREVQLDAICLYTNVLMTENRLFYHKLGFEEEGYHVQNGYHRVFLRKRLIQS
jgi:ribosomal protein S18 acetylase RimI-like enzyme